MEASNLNPLYTQLISGNELKIKKGEDYINVRESDIPVTVLNKFLQKAKDEFGSKKITTEQYDTLKAKINLILEKKPFTEKIHQFFHKLFAKENSWKNEPIQSVTYESIIKKYEAETDLDITSMEDLKNTDFSKYPNLRILNLKGTDIEKLPKSINQLTSLEEINFTSSGTPLKTLPKEIGDLSSLKILNLKNTNITHLPDSICKLQNLEMLKISIGSPGHSGQGGGIISGRGGGGKSNTNIKETEYLQNLPKNIGNLKNLKVLDISDTYIVTLPKSIGECDSLKEIIVERGNLSNLPDEIGNLKNLEKLEIKNTNSNRNTLTTLPNTISNLSSLKTLNLMKSGIQSLADITFPTSLETLNLNGIEKGISNSIYDCENLIHLDLSNTLIPNFEKTDLSKLSKLEKLYLKGNQLNSLPESTSSLTSLKILDLSYNKFIKIPPELLNLDNLEEISLKFNSIEVVENCFNNNNKLKEIDLEFNPLHTIDNSFSQCEKLEKVSLAASKTNSKPEGQVTNAFNECPNLKILKLNDMNLTSLESSFKDTNLEQLDISRNNLSSLPECVTDCKSLKDLNLFWNRKIKTIPESLKNLENLECLNARDCSITTIEPLSGMQKLKLIDLSGNYFDKLPSIVNIGEDNLEVRLYSRAITQDDCAKFKNSTHKEERDFNIGSKKYFSITYHPNLLEENA